MSYDLTLFPVPAGLTPDATYRRWLDEEEKRAANLEGWQTQTLPASSRAQMQALADALKARFPQLTQFEPASPLPWIELNDEALSVQISISDGYAGITMPYFGDDAEDKVAAVQQCVAAINEFAGYVAYDPQLGRALDPADFEAVLQQYRHMDSALPDILAEVARSGKKPWWKFW